MPVEEFKSLHFLPKHQGFQNEPHFCVSLDQEICFEVPVEEFKLPLCFGEVFGRKTQSGASCRVALGMFACKKFPVPGTRYTGVFQWYFRPITLVSVSFQWCQGPVAPVWFQWCLVTCHTFVSFQWFWGPFTPVCCFSGVGDLLHRCVSVVFGTCYAGVLFQWCLGLVMLVCCFSGVW